ncbi:MAG: uroporphyrinogen decarboxylase family protein [Phycisphaerae bacterium]
MTTSKQLVLTAVAHKAPERNPITFDAQSEVYDTLYKHLKLKTREQLYDFLHCDTWMVQPKVQLSDEEKALKQTQWGWRTVTANYGGGAYEELAWSPLAGKDDLSDIDKHAWPDPAKRHDWSHIAAEVPAHKDRAIIGACCWGAYFTASFVRGMEGIMMDLALNHAYAEKLIGRISEIIQAMVTRMLTAPGAEGIDIVYMADDTCNHRAPMFSPATFKKFIVPYLSKMTGIAHKHGKKFLLHTCGAVRPVLPMIIDAGVDMLEPIQITAAGMDPEGLKRDFGRDICFYGGVDLQHVLNEGTPQTVADEVRRLIDILGKDGGYIIGPGHTYIQVDAPIDNILAMYKTAYEYRPHS